jgi:hypothetical protein
MTCAAASTAHAPQVRDVEIIDSELRLLAAVRRVCREYDASVPSIMLVDELLDERRALTD